MKTREFSILINSTPEILWNCLWKSENYKKWTEVFLEGSYYKADDLKEASFIHFLTPEGHGMYSIIKEIQINRFMFFQHLGELKNFEEQHDSPSSELWKNAIESYEILPENTGVKLIVKVDIVEEYIPAMNKSFPLALQVLKTIAEQS
jgi:hypothetical protein